MHRWFIILGLAAGAAMAPLLHASAPGYATDVTQFDPGVGFATEYGSGLGYTNLTAVLGSPSRDTEFGAVTPFNPPFARSDLLSIGEGGHVVLQMGTPIRDLAANPFGLDFIIYGSAGFIDIDYPNGFTDGSASMFGQNLGETRVWVSSDNVQFFQLDPMLAPVVDGWFPTDGLGVFGRPVDPALTAADFSNRSLEEIRSLYQGSAGGSAYDLAWARDDLGQPVRLDEVHYVRIDVLSGRAELDGVAVVPEPGRAIQGLALACLFGWVTWRRRWRARVSSSKATC